MDAATFALPATARQIAFARSLALRNQSLLPWEVQQDRRSLSAWIEAQSQLKPAENNQPTSKQSLLPSVLRGSSVAPCRMNVSETGNCCRAGSTGTSEAAGPLPATSSG